MRVALLLMALLYPTVLWADVRVVWRCNQEANVTGYQVNRSTDNATWVPAFTVAHIPGCRWMGANDTASLPGGKYFYQVVALADDGQQSKPSNTTAKSWVKLRTKKGGGK